MERFLNVNSIAFSIGKFDVYWYGLIICLAIMLVIVLACFMAKKKGYSVDMPLNVALVILPTGILCGRLFSVLFDEGLSITDYFNFRTGGMSIIGAIIGGGLGLLVYTFIKKDKDKLKYFDILCAVLILAQAIGRWGNYFNGEVYGKLIDSNSWAAHFPIAVKIGENYYQALFFYESVLDIIGFVFLCEIYLGTKRSGNTTAFYLIYYGVVRTVLESFRNEKYILRLWGLPISQVCSAIMIAVGIGIYVYLYIKSKNSSRKLANGQETKE